jgi:acyl carrier protein
VSLLESAVPAVGDSVAVAYADAVLTYRELNSRADRLAAGLHVEPGERIVIVAPNVPGLLVALFGAWKLGAVAVPLSARLRGFELKRAFATTSPTAALSVASHGSFDLARELRRLQDETSTLGECLTIDPLGAVTDQSRSAAERADPLDEAIAAIIHTSGSTGEPKGAVVSHRQALAQGENLPPLLGDYAAASCGLAAPATHSFGLNCTLCTLAACGTLILADVSASAAPLVNALQHFSAKALHGSPALFIRLLETPADLALTCGFVAGSSCSPALLERSDQRGLRLLNQYGMTEMGAACCSRSDDPPDVRYRTSGRPLAGYEVRVAPHASAPASAGEIQVRSPNIWPYYLFGGRTNIDTTPDGWFRTGDLGSVDESGSVSIVGRTKEVIQVGGFNVFPAEVEMFLLTDPRIVEAAVVGVPHAVMGEVPQAFVVPGRQVELEPGDVVRFARAGIAGYKVPYAVRILDELPRLPSGKLDRKELTRIAGQSNSGSQEVAVPSHGQFAFDDLKHILVRRLGVAEDQIEDDTSATFDQMGLDSLAFIEFQTALEEDWGVRVRDEDAERVYTIGDAIHFVNARLAEQELTEHD